jgi:hypothetical protein
MHENTLAVARVDGGTVDLVAQQQLPERPFATGVVDFDGDEFPDLVAAYGTADEVGILTGSASLDFEVGPTVPVSAGPGQIAIGDLDDDGVDDALALLEGGDEVVGILLDGKGGYETTDALMVGETPRAAVMVDVSGNEIPDVFATGYDAERLTFAENDGSGSLDVAGTMMVGSPFGVAAASVDGWSGTTVAVARVLTDSLLLTTWEDGQFAELATAPVGCAPKELALVDIDVDGMPELFVMAQGDAAIELYELDPGKPGEVEKVQEFSIGGLPHEFVVADLDGDGAEDLAAVAAESDELVVVLRDP